MQETWKDVPGYEGKYQVSNNGLVKSLVKEKPHILKPNITRGYRSIGLSDGAGHKKLFLFTD